MVEQKKGIGWKAPVEIELSSGEKVQVLAYLTPPAFYCLKQAVNTQTKEFDEKLFTKEILQYFLQCMVVDPPLTPETFQNSDILLLSELAEKIMRTCDFSKEKMATLKSPPTKP